MMHFCAITKSNDCSLFACFESLQCPKLVLTVIKKNMFFKSFRGSEGAYSPPPPPDPQLVFTWAAQLFFTVRRPWGEMHNQQSIELYFYSEYQIHEIVTHKYEGSPWDVARDEPKESCQLELSERVTVGPRGILTKKLWTDFDAVFFLNLFESYLKCKSNEAKYKKISHLKKPENVSADVTQSENETFALVLMPAWVWAKQKMKDKTRRSSAEGKLSSHCDANKQENIGFFASIFDKDSLAVNLTFWN